MSKNYIIYFLSRSCVLLLREFILSVLSHTRLFCNYLQGRDFLQFPKPEKQAKTILFNIYFKGRTVNLLLLKAFENSTGVLISCPRWQNLGQKIGSLLRIPAQVRQILNGIGTR